MSLSRKRILELRALVQTALDGIPGCPDVIMSAAHCTYGETGSVKIEISPVGDDGVAVTKEASAWNSYAVMHGCKVEWLGQSFTTPKGREHTITGWRPRARKQPILTTCGGKEYVWPVSAVKANMEASHA